MSNGMSVKEKKVSFVEEPEVASVTSHGGRLPATAVNIRARKEGNRTFVDHNQMELARARAELRLTSYIVQMTEKPIPPHTPNIWNGLRPYARTYDPEFVNRLPNDTFVGGQSRITVQNIVDPEIDVMIDQTKVTLPDINLTRRQLLSQRREERMKLPSTGEDILDPKSKPIPWSQKEGSTHLTPFAKVNYRRPEIAMHKGTINFTHVKELRQQMQQMYGTRAQQKNDIDFARTSKDFYRMDLNVARNRAHPLNRYLLDQACRVYLGPSRGSLRAYNELTRPLTTLDDE
ncbi:uncharacterized protein LOC120333313 [Styela clava]|uniref:uncharacterized protein LOC120333313 n=1 Tax=Styela clava TaxID=7725 RepID=UPI00193AA76F|nr:uncharacterized protein LOC120333313 [Styela clava]